MVNNMLRNLINYVKDKDYLVAIYKNKIYIYNYKYILDITSNDLKVNLGNIKVKINGKDIMVEKLENNEMLIKLECKGLEFYE